MEFLNADSVTAIGVALTALFGLLTARMTRKNRTATRDVLDVAQQAADSADTAVQNTNKVGNGFADRMDRKLDEIQRSQEETNRALRSHLEWHLNKETPK